MRISPMSSSIYSRQQKKVSFGTFRDERTEDKVDRLFYVRRDNPDRERLVARNARAREALKNSDFIELYTDRDGYVTFNMNSDYINANAPAILSTFQLYQSVQLDQEKLARVGQLVYEFPQYVERAKNPKKLTREDFERQRQEDAAKYGSQADEWAEERLSWLAQ